MNWFIGAPAVQHGSNPVNLVLGLGHASHTAQLAKVQEILTINNANR